MFNRKPNHQITILIVSDDDITRGNLSLILKKMGCRVIYAENCLHLKFAFLFFSHIHAAIVEITDSQKTCLKVTKNIIKLHNKIQHNERVPIILVTDNGKINKTVNDCYDYYLIKPISEEHLAKIFYEIGLIQSTDIND